MTTTFAPAATRRDPNAASHQAWCDQARHDRDGLASCVSRIVEGAGFAGWVTAEPGGVARAWFAGATPDPGLDREGVAQLMTALRDLGEILEAAI